MTILAIVCDPPNTLLFADRRYEDTVNGVSQRGEMREVQNPDTGEFTIQPLVKVNAQKGVIWGCAGMGAVLYEGRGRMAQDVIGIFFDQMQDGKFVLSDLVEFLSPLVIERGSIAPGGLHVLLGTAAEAFYFWFPSDPRAAPAVEQVQRKIIPSHDTKALFGGWFPTHDEFFPPPSSSPEAIAQFMRPLLERAIAWATEQKGLECDVAGPVDVALVSPTGARILEAGT